MAHVLPNTQRQHRPSTQRTQDEHGTGDDVREEKLYVVDLYKKMKPKPATNSTSPVTDAHFKQEALAEMKYVSIEASDNLRPEWPRDSLEPEIRGAVRDSDERHHGMTRDSNERHYGSLRSTDELVQNVGRLQVRSSDEPFIKQEVRD